MTYPLRDVFFRSFTMHVHGLWYHGLAVIRKDTGGVRLFIANGSLVEELEAELCKTIGNLASQLLDGRIDTIHRLGCRLEFNARCFVQCYDPKNEESGTFEVLHDEHGVTGVKPFVSVLFIRRPGLVDHAFWRLQMGTSDVNCKLDFPPKCVWAETAIRADDEPTAELVKAPELSEERWQEIVEQAFLAMNDLRHLPEFPDANPCREVTDKYEPLVEDYMRFFTFDHLPTGPMRTISARFAMVARAVVHDCPSCPQKLQTLSKLLEAKDAAVRSLLPVAKA